MLIYNFKKEFIGIEQKDLQTLGFQTLADLKSEIDDFADLFVKTPGYVHNFKHVHWIDFIQYAEASEDLKVIISANKKSFKATLSLNKLFLADNPTTPAYGINLQNLRILSENEQDSFSNEIFEQKRPKKVETQPTVDFNINSDTLDVFEDQQEPAEAISFEAPVETETTVSIDVEEEKLQPEIELEVPSVQEEPKVQTAEKSWANHANYDPHIASEELGLPLDLIEEFIQDFIVQAKEFKPDIYRSLEDGDIDTVKTLSHKLKGVAANLRVENAFEVLSIINSSSDLDLIREKLNHFYVIIAELANEEPTEAFSTVQITPEIEEEEEELLLDFKEDDEPFPDEILTIEDEDVPQKIDIPELADDDFFEVDVEEEETIKEEFEDQEVELQAADEEILELSIEEPEDDAKEELTLVEESIESEIPEIEEEIIINYSKSEAAKEIGIDEESFNELFEDFIQESREILNKVKTAIANDDSEICQSEMIKFKGMSENMRFNELDQEADTLMHAQSSDEKQKALETIEKAIEKISREGE